MPNGSVEAGRSCAEKHYGRGGAHLRRAFVILLLLAAITAALVTTAFWWDAEPVSEPLAPGWEATVHVLAGSGVTGVGDGRGLRAQFVDPFGVAVGPDGLIYVTDGAGGNRIRVITRNGEVATYAGSRAGFRDGAPHEAQFNAPSGLAFDDRGALYVADTANNAVRRVSPTGETATIAGGPLAGFADGPAGEALFNGPIGIAVDASGRIVVADTYNDRIRVIGLDGSVGTLAGGARGYADGFATEARFDTPTGLAIDANGTIYVADTGNDSVRVITSGGQVSTLIEAAHGLVRPLGITLSQAGELYVTTEDGRIFERSGDGSIRVLAGTIPGFRNGPGSEARFRRPAGIAWHQPGHLVVADTGNAMVRVIGAKVSVHQPHPGWPFEVPRFRVEEFAQRPLLWPLDPLYGPFEVAGTMGEARGENANRFHAGIDVRAEHGTEVLAVREGVVSAPLSVSSVGTLNEAVRIGPVAYVHIRAGRDRFNRVRDHARFVATYDETGRFVDIRVKRGASFDVGDTVGTVNPFNHVHLNVGWPGEEHNPLLLRLPRYRDSIPPTIGGIQLFSASGERLRTRAQGRLLVSGEVRIVVDAWDQADGNRPYRRLGLFELGYQVLHADGTPAPGFESPRMTLRFNRLGSDGVAPALVYAAGSGIPFYSGGRTRFLYVVTNSFRDGKAAAGMWDTRELAPGDYLLRIHARDSSGNTALANRDLPIRVLTTAEDGQTADQAR
jgi:sugar lactone lactonase YvrE